MLIRVLALRARSPGCCHNELCREKAEGNGGAEGEKREKRGVKEGRLVRTNHAKEPQQGEYFTVCRFQNSV